MALTQCLKLVLATCGLILPLSVMLNNQIQIAWGRLVLFTTATLLIVLLLSIFKPGISFSLSSTNWLRLRGNRYFSGDGTRNDQYFNFSAEVRAVADGTVVSLQDGMPEEMPNQPVKNVKKPADFVGNHVVVQIRPDVWATYAHLQTGSIKVQVGNRVKTGQVIGKLGNRAKSDR